MTSAGSHWREAALHFEWRQRVLDETLAALTLARTHASERSSRVMGQLPRSTTVYTEPTTTAWADLAAVATALAAWSDAQGQLDRDVADWKAQENPPPYPGKKDGQA